MLLNLWYVFNKNQHKTPYGRNVIALLFRIQVARVYTKDISWPIAHSEFVLKVPCCFLHRYVLLYKNLRIIYHILNRSLFFTFSIVRV